MVLIKNTFICLFILLSLSAFSQQSLNEAFVKSFTLEENGKYSEAANVIKKAYRTDSYEANLRLGWLLYNAGAYQESVHYYTTASKLLPYSVEALLALTLPKSALQHWNDVLTIYGIVLSIDKKNYTALYNVGLIYYNRGQFNVAFDYFSEIHNLYPTNYDAMLMHGWSAFKLGKSREAKVIFNQVLLLYPGDESATAGLDIMK